MFKDTAVHFLLIHCFGAFVFAQGARYFFDPKEVIIETINDIDGLKKNPQDMPNDLFYAPKEIQDDHCLTKNMNIFEQEAVKITFQKGNETNCMKHICNKLKCLQSLCSRLNNKNEHGNCMKQKKDTKAFLTDLEDYLKHISSNGICPKPSKTYKACQK